VRKLTVEIPLPGSSSGNAPAEPYDAAPGAPNRAELPRWARVLRHRNADSLQVDARRCARLYRPFADESRNILRPPSVSADAQATADDQRNGSLLPSRALFSGRRLARRSPTRIHPDRYRAKLHGRRRLLSD